MVEAEAILIVGGDSTLGSALTRWFQAREIEVWQTTRRPETAIGHRLFLDLARDVSEWEAPRSLKTAYLCAAHTSIEFCEKNPAISEHLNVHTTTQLAAKLIAAGTRVVFLSTNQVFDGAVPRRKDDEFTCPRSEYGKQKAQAEKNLRTLDARSIVVRLTKVLDPAAKLFADWKTRLRSGLVIQPFKNMFFAPLPIDFAVDALATIGLKGSGGIYQVSPEQDISYANAAFRMAAQLGANRDLVQPISCADRGLAQTVAPRFTTLDASRIKNELQLIPPAAEGAIDWLVPRLS